MVTMTSRLRQNSDQGPPPSSAPAAKPQFFKTILSAALRDGKIGIPKKFVRRFGKDLSDTMFLKVPGGGVWKLGLVRGEDGEVWLQRGWRAFAEHYSLDHGHFLVFRHEKESVFRVLILDTSACEIEYPSSTHDQQQDPVNKIGGSASVTVEIPRAYAGPIQRKGSREQNSFRTTDASAGKPDGVLRPKADTRSPLRPQPAKMKNHRNSPRKAHEIMSSGGATGLKFVKVEADLDSDKAGPNGERPRHKYHTRESRRRGPSKEVAALGALERAMAFKPVNPVFLVKMGAAYLRKTYAHIPSSFAKAYLEKRNQSVKVRGSDGRMWRMTCHLHRRGTCGYETPELSSGWRMFVQDNQLKLGDVCAFELLKSSPVLLKVFIFRNSTDEDHHQS